MRVFFAPLLAFIVTRRSPSARPATRTRRRQPPPHSRHSSQVTPEFCTGGQPRPVCTFARLKADGVKSVLNLRTPGEQRGNEATDEQDAVQKAGLKYTLNIPVVYTRADGRAGGRFLRLTDDPANRPMFIHCTAAVRAGAFWAIRRALRDGMTVDAALAEGRKVGMVNAPHLEEFVRRFVAARKPS